MAVRAYRQGARADMSEPITDDGAAGEAIFEQWATDSPERLIQAMCGGKLRPTLLTFAAEIAGNHLPSEQIVPALLGLLEHADPIVREGAIYGLAYHEGENISAALRKIVESDSSPGVREAATCALDARRDATTAAIGVRSAA